jgi:hypothetical protein
MVEEERRKIEWIMDKTGLTEEEARANYHLMEAYSAMIEVTETPVVPGAKPMGPTYALSHIAPHFDTLQGFLAKRVLERERPEGWERGGPTEPETEDEP